MIKINPVSVINHKNNVNIGFTSDLSSQNLPQIDKTPEVTADYGVKTPMRYSKTGELNLPYDTKAHLYKMANGQRVIIIPHEGETVVKTYVNTGSMNEPDNIRGISHYIEHNLFNGSDGLEAGEFFKTANQMGAETNASTGFAQTNYYVSSFLLNDTDLENKIKIHASMIETPRFSEDMLEKEKGIVNSEINMITSDPYNIATQTTIKNLFGIKTKSEDIIGGTTDNITNLTRKDVVDYFNKNYYPANMVTVISGEIEPENTMKLVSKYFSSMKTPSNDRYYEKFNIIDKPVRQDIISDKATSTIIEAGFAGAPSNNVKDDIYLGALTMLLTSSSEAKRLIKPLNSRIYAEEEKISSNPNISQAVVFSCETNDENSEKILKLLYSQIAKRTKIPATNEEMEIIRKKMLNSFSDIFEYSATINNIVGDMALNDNLDYFKEFEKTVKEMTPQDLMDVAKKYLDLNKVAITVVHPDNVSKDNIISNHNEAKSVSFTGSNKKQVLNPDNVKQYQMQNNTMVVTNNTKAGISSFNITLNTNSLKKTDKPATSILLSGLLNKGSALRDDAQFYNDMDKLDISIGFNSSLSEISCHAEFDSNDTDYALQSAKEVLLNPRFTQEDLDYQKNLLKDVILQSETKAKNKINEELFKGLERGYSKNDVLNSIDNVTLDDVKNLYLELLNDSQASVTMSAPFEKHPELKATLFKNISQLPDMKPFEPKILDTYYPITETKVLTDTHNKNQADIMMAYKFKTNGNMKDNVTLRLLNEILGGGSSSRLFDDLREKQKLAYGVRSKLVMIDNSGMLYLSIGTTTENKQTGEVSFDNIEKSIEGFKYHINKLMSEKVSEEELKNAKLSLKNMLLYASESNLDKTNMLDSGVSSLYGALSKNEFFDMIDKITADDIYNAANYIFKEKPTYSIVATENSLSANEKYLNSLAD